MSVEVSEIDKQHQQLVSLINQLHDAMLQKQGKQVISKIIEELSSYTEYHFTKEEAYMEKFKYPGLSAQKIEHQTFVKKVKEFQKDYDSGKLGLSIEVMNFLQSWVSNHIKGSDKKYSETFHKNGLK